MRGSSGTTLLACLLAIGCGDETDRDDDPVIPTPDAGEASPDAGDPEPLPDAAATSKECEGAELELGTGFRTYEPVRDGDTIDLFRGPQGGYMVYLSLRARGLEPSDVTLCYTLRFASGTQKGDRFGEGCWKIMLTNDLGDGRHERVGIWGAVESSYWTSPGRIRGQDARVDVTATDGEGCGAKAGWDVHIAEEPPM